MCGRQRISKIDVSDSHQEQRYLEGTRASVSEVDLEKVGLEKVERGRTWPS